MNDSPTPTPVEAVRRLSDQATRCAKATAQLAESLRGLRAAVDTLRAVVCAICWSGRYCSLHDANRKTLGGVSDEPVVERG